jgi:hypothetical protein
MKDAIEPFHRDDLKRVRELTYLRASTEAYFLLDVRAGNSTTTPFFVRSPSRIRLPDGHPELSNGKSSLFPWC